MMPSPIIASVVLATAVYGILAFVEMPWHKILELSNSRLVKILELRLTDASFEAFFLRIS